MAHEANYVIGPQDDRVPPPIEDQQLGPGQGLQGQDLVLGAGHGEPVVGTMTRPTKG